MAVPTAAKTTPRGAVLSSGCAIGAIAPGFSSAKTSTLPLANSARAANRVPAGRKTMKAKNTVAKNPTTVHALYSSPITLKVNSAPAAISTATTIKFNATCSQNRLLTLSFFVVMTAAPLLFAAPPSLFPLTALRGFVAQMPFAQHSLVDLADRGQRQLLDHHDPIRDRELRDDALVDIRPHVGANGLFPGFRGAAGEVRLHDDERHRTLAPFGVLDGDDRRFHNAVLLRDDVLHLKGGDPFAAALDDVFDAVDDVDGSV